MGWGMGVAAVTVRLGPMCVWGEGGGSVATVVVSCLCHALPQEQ